jgi:hypothetical protein
MAQHTLTLRNEGNTPAGAALSAADPDGQLAFVLSPPTVAAAPGGEGSATIRVRARKLIFLGQETPRPFAVTAQPEGGEAVTADGTMVQRPLAPKWVMAAVPVVVAALAFFGIRLTGGASYEEEVLKDAPTAYWRLDEEPGATDASDRSGNGNAAVYEGVELGASGALTDEENTGARFDGIDDVVLLPPGLFFGGDFTIEAWVNLAPGIDNQDSIFGRGMPGQDVNFFGGRLRIFTGNFADVPFDVIIATTAVPPGQFTYCVITRSGSSLSLYLDGRLDAEGQWNQPFAPTGMGRGNVGFLRGTLDEVALYDHALPPDRIQAHFDAR